MNGITSALIIAKHYHFAETNRKTYVHSMEAPDDMIICNENVIMAT